MRPHGACCCVKRVFVPTIVPLLTDSGVTSRRISRRPSAAAQRKHTDRSQSIRSRTCAAFALVASLARSGSTRRHFEAPDGCRTAQEVSRTGAHATRGAVAVRGNGTDRAHSAGRASLSTLGRYVTEIVKYPAL